MATSPVAGGRAVRAAGPATDHDRRPPRSWPAVLLSAGVVAGLFTVQFLRNHRFAYLDDRQADGVAKLVDMGRILAAGKWPWLSTNVVNSGGYAVEYQNGVFNPVNLAFGVLMGHLDDAAFASFLQLLAHLTVLAAAAAWLGRLVGLSTAWSVAFAASVGFGPYTVFWGAGWYQAVVSFSWFVLAVAAVVALHRTEQQRYGWVLLVAAFLCHQSGWPLAIPVLGLFVAAVVVARLVTGCARGATGWIAAWYGGGVLTPLVGLYPLLVSFRFASRSSSISNEANANVAPLEGLLHAADPSYYGWFTSFDGYRLQELPHFYVAWFVLPVLLLWRPAPVGPRVRALAGATVALSVVTALGALGPERALVFRFPTRFLQYWGFFLLLAVALLVAHGRFAPSGRRLAALAASLVLLVLNSLQADPDGPARVVGLGALTAVLCLALVGPRPARPPGRRWRLVVPDAPGRASGAVVAVGTVLVLGVLGWLHPMARGFDWGFPQEPGALETLSREDYTLWYGSYAPLEAPGELPSPAPQAEQYYEEYRPSSTGLLTGDRQINGYSPLAHRFLREHVPLDDHGNFGDSGAELFTSVDGGTGLTWLELLRVDQVVAQHGPRDVQLAEELDGSWRRTSIGEHTSTYRRAPYRLPGLVSYAAPGVEIEDRESCRRQHSRECVRVSGGDGGRVVFARLWFPGYTATFAGRPVDVVRYEGTLVAVDLPAGAAGDLVLSYRSPAVVPLGSLAVAVVAGLAGAQVVASRRARAVPRGRAEPAEVSTR
ncbi:hypothetical protein [Blastococcus sp. TF02A-30]|uniref:hypothetical protein n=1 Tax=Blastococcus sp. TF02A-30 TaxID=2250580 RepID=UPI001314AF88|nr:hypothetical protein [Blastococcus sp. TF02A-30]